MRSTLFVLVSALGVSWSMAARAQPGDQDGDHPSSQAEPSARATMPSIAADDPQGDFCSDPPDPDSRQRTVGEEVDQQAARYHEEAEARYLERDLSGALAAMQQAYRVSAHPELFFKLGSVLREMGRCRAALTCFRQYLTWVPSGEWRGEAAQAASQLERECPRNAASVAPAPPPAPAPVRPNSTPPPPPPPAGHYWTTARIAGWTTIAAGAIAGAAAVGFQVDARNAKRDIDELETSAAIAARGGNPIPWVSRRDQLSDRGDRSRDYARILAVAGAGLVTGGTLLVLFGSHRTEAPAPGVSLGVHPGGATLWYRRSF